MTAPIAPVDSTDRITQENRHQFFETAIASVSDADHQIRQAEARGRQRVLREEELRRKIRRIAFGALCLGLATIAALLIAWVLRTH